MGLPDVEKSFEMFRRFEDGLTDIARTTAKTALMQIVARAKNVLYSWFIVNKLTFDLESGIRVTYDVGYLYANFSLHWPLCSRLRSDVRDKQTDTLTLT